jgi:hypothetical protein
MSECGDPLECYEKSLTGQTDFDLLTLTSTDVWYTRPAKTSGRPATRREPAASAPARGQPETRGIPPPYQAKYGRNMGET